MDLKKILNSTPSSTPTVSTASGSTLRGPMDQHQNDYGARPTRVPEVTMVSSTASTRPAQGLQEKVWTRAMSSEPSLYEHTSDLKATAADVSDRGTAWSIKPAVPLQHHLSESPAKKGQSKWTGGDDAVLIELRGRGVKWEDISKHFIDRSAMSCRLRHQNYLERCSEWSEDEKDKLASLYERLKEDMWGKIASEMQRPWRNVEAMHWQMGEAEMIQRANGTGRPRGPL